MRCQKAKAKVPKIKTRTGKMAEYGAIRETLGAEDLNKFQFAICRRESHARPIGQRGGSRLSRQTDQLCSAIGDVECAYSLSNRDGFLVLHLARAIGHALEPEVPCYPAHKGIWNSFFLARFPPVLPYLFVSKPTCHMPHATT